ncbi:hypothetical protein QL285_095748 [Trifolium repens]|jgi:hypothetical protein|nr:hypothetical protein QL285_095748 [Trifolium repens]
MSFSLKIMVFSGYPLLVSMYRICFLFSRECLCYQKVPVWLSYEARDAAYWSCYRDFFLRCFSLFVWGHNEYHAFLVVIVMWLIVIILLGQWV